MKYVHPSRFPAIGCFRPKKGLRHAGRVGWAGQRAESGARPMTSTRGPGPGCRLKAVHRASATFTCPNSQPRAGGCSERPSAGARSRNIFLESGNRGAEAHILNSAVHAPNSAHTEVLAHTPSELKLYPPRRFTHLHPPRLAVLLLPPLLFTSRAPSSPVNTASQAYYT